MCHCRIVFKYLASLLSVKRYRWLSTYNNGMNRKSVSSIVNLEHDAENDDISRAEIKQYPGVSGTKSSRLTTKYIWQWLDDDTLNKYMLSQVIYNADGLVAVNKPYGLYVGRKENPKGKEIHPYTVRQTIPYLCEQLGYDDLCVVGGIDYARFQSGVMLLAKSEKLAKCIRRAVHSALAAHMLSLRFWCITLGCPVPHIGPRQKILLAQEDICEGVRLPVVVSVRDGRHTHEPVMEYRTISMSRSGRDCASLVEIDTSPLQQALYPLHVYMAHRACSILGDQQFSTRVKTVLGRSVCIDARSCRPAPQVLPDNVMSALKLLPLGAPRSDSQRLLISSMLPQHIHLRRVTVPAIRNALGFPRKEVVIECEPPDHFTWTMEQLTLNPTQFAHTLTVSEAEPDYS